MKFDSVALTWCLKRMHVRKAPAMTSDSAERVVLGHFDVWEKMDTNTTLVAAAVHGWRWYQIDI